MRNTHVSNTASTHNRTQECQSGALPDTTLSLEQRQPTAPSNSHFMPFPQAPRAQSQ